MEDRPIPPPLPRLLVRSCESSRLQRQLLVQAYQQVCPQVRRKLVSGPIGASDGNSSFAAARRAEGA